MNKIVTNEEYVSASKNKDNIKIMKSVYSKYEPYMDQDDIDSCCSVALWKTLKKNDPSKGEKFTTMLHNYTTWECYSVLKRNSQHDIEINYDNLDNIAISNSGEYNCEIRDCLDVLQSKDKKILEDFYLYKKSLSEIAKETGKDKQKIKEDLHRAAEKFKFHWEKE